MSGYKVMLVSTKFFTLVSRLFFFLFQASVCKNGTTPLMRIEMILMYIEIIYLWRALPFCNEVTKLHLLELLEGAKPSNGIPFHYGMRHC